MLSFYETFQKCNTPSSLKDEIFNSEGDKLELIDNLSKVNIFIGANNTGKSKILREILKSNLSFHYGKKNWEKITTLITNFFDKAKVKFKEAYNKDSFILSNSVNGQILNTNELRKTIEKIITYKENYQIKETCDFLYNTFIITPSGVERGASFTIRDENSSDTYIPFDAAKKILLKLDELKEDAVSTINELEKFQFIDLSPKEITRIYIPSVRTLRPFGARINIENETKKEYKFLENVKVYNGQSLPQEVFDLTNSPYEKRQKIIEFENLLSQEFFESKLVKLTFDKESQVLLIKIGDEKERPIHEQGDGLQMIIILTFPFFANRSGIVIIEEPELFIHPGLQKIFIKFLISNRATENFQIFIATHSNHIIDSINNSDRVSLFSINKRTKKIENSVEKTPDFIIENLAFGNNNLLNLLGITNSSVYLSNCTVWVEGITDKIYIQKFMSEYLKGINENSKYSICKRYQEGINYSFALTGGDSIIHWDFSDNNEYYENTHKVIVNKFCGKSLVIVDNDFKKNQTRKEKLKELLGDRFIELDMPEIENLLPQIVINNTILEFPSVSKTVNRSDLPIIERNVFRVNKIGYIIDKLILKEHSSAKSFSNGKEENSSLKNADKYTFCNKAINHISKDNLTSESTNLVEKILDFIISRNTF